MQAVRSKDTGPEMQVRRFLFGIGYRYTLHAGKLPGRPDIVFTKRKKVIYVHGCFWHQHQNCKGSSIPKSNLDYWGPKLRRNVARDAENQERITSLGWEYLVVWECQVKKLEGIRESIENFLGPKRADAV